MGNFLLGLVAGACFFGAALLMVGGTLVVPGKPLAGNASAKFGYDGTTCYAFQMPQADGLGEHLIFCEDGRYGIHKGAAFMPRLHPEEVANGNAP